MSSAPASRALRWAIHGATVYLVAGCAYFNTLYNAQYIYQEAEDLRRAGQDAEASERYAAVVDKAQKTYERDTEGQWADDALYLLGRAHLRRGNLFEARVALERALAFTTDFELRHGAELYLGAVTALSGDPEAGLVLIDEAIRDLPPGRLDAEAHLWRGRVNLSLGRLEAGWQDLEDAVAGHDALRVSADLERLRWGVAHVDSARARAGARGLLARSEGAASADSLHALVTLAGAAWGPAVAASLLSGAEGAPWPSDVRDGTLLVRAALHAEAGADAEAVRDAERAAQGLGALGVRARIWLAGFELARADSVPQLDAIRPVLLPAVGADGVLRLLEALRKVEMLTSPADGGDAIALFAAAELARDELGAPRLAVSLFQRFAELEAGSPWAGKALLAALALLPAGPEQDAVRARLDRERASPYVRVAAGDPVEVEEYERLEQALLLALASVLADVTVRAAERDILVRERSPGAPGERRVP
jgi:tetratricopeptide (TPR) repeat protein